MTLLGLLGYGLIKAVTHWGKVWPVLITALIALAGAALVILLIIFLVWFFTERLPRSETVNLITTRIADYKERKCTKIELY